MVFSPKLPPSFVSLTILFSSCCRYRSYTTCRNSSSSLYSILLWLNPMFIIGEFHPDYLICPHYQFFPIFERTFCQKVVFTTIRRQNWLFIKNRRLHLIIVPKFSSVPVPVCYEINIHYFRSKRQYWGSTPYYGAQYYETQPQQWSSQQYQVWVQTSQDSFHRISLHFRTIKTTTPLTSTGINISKLGKIPTRMPTNPATTGRHGSRKVATDTQLHRRITTLKAATQDQSTWRQCSLSQHFRRLF